MKFFESLLSPWGIIIVIIVLIILMAFLTSLWDYINNICCVKTINRDVELIDNGVEVI